jgi:hypothetical protein
LRTPGSTSSASHAQVELDGVVEFPGVQQGVLLGVKFLEVRGGRVASDGAADEHERRDSLRPAERKLECDLPTSELPTTAARSICKWSKSAHRSSTKENGPPGNGESPKPRAS